MKLHTAASALFEMGKPSQVCPKCGHSPIHKTHRYNAKDPNDKWRCIHAPLPGFPQQGGATSPVSSPASSPAAAPITSTPAAAPTARATAPAAPRAQAPAPAPTQTVVHTPGATKMAPAPRLSGSDLHSRIDTWLKEQDITGYTINDDHTVDIDGDYVNLDFPHTKIPVKFGRVTGDFSIHGKIKSFEGCPDYVGGNFEVTHTLITSFEGLPSEVGGDCDLEGNKLVTSIEGLPATIGGNLSLKECKGIKSLSKIHRIVTEVGGGQIDCSQTSVNESVIGVLMIEGVTQVLLPDSKVQQILENFLKSEDRDTHDCQEALISAGFRQYAKL